jgi:DNA polymerase-3 subunit delta'
MPSIPEIVGHEKQCGQLLADIAHHNVSQAYLFVGPKHIGKFTIARWFAWRLLVDGKAPSEQAALRDQVERLIHPDMLSLDTLWIENVQEDWGTISATSNIPQQHRAKNPTAKTDTIGIDEVRLLHDRLLATGSSSHLCCLIRSVERMPPATANAFLKILEEPPPRVVFILTAESTRSLLPTVVSRTRVMQFHPLSAAEMRPLLADQDDEDGAFALHLAHGAPGTLLSLLQNPEALRVSKQLHAQTKQFWRARSAHERLNWIMPFADQKTNMTDLLRHLGATLREHPDHHRKAAWTAAYIDLAEALRSNAHRGLLLERFTLAVTKES